MTDLEIKYFDTIAPCTSICVLRSGFLFAASEFSNHALYQFQVSSGGCQPAESAVTSMHTMPMPLHPTLQLHLQATTFMMAYLYTWLPLANMEGLACLPRSSMKLRAASPAACHLLCLGQTEVRSPLLQSTGEEDPVLSRASELQQSEEGFAPVFFNPRPLTCLVLIDEMESLMPVTHMEVSCPQAAYTAGSLSPCHGYLCGALVQSGLPPAGMCLTHCALTGGHVATLQAIIADRDCSHCCATCLRLIKPSCRSPTSSTRRFPRSMLPAGGGRAAV